MIDLNKTYKIAVFAFIFALIAYSTAISSTPINGTNGINGTDGINQSDNTKVNKTGDDIIGIFKTPDENIKIVLADDADLYNWYIESRIKDPITLYNSYLFQSADMITFLMFDNNDVEKTRFEQNVNYIEIGNGKKLRIDKTGYRFSGLTTKNQTLCSTSLGYLSYCTDLNISYLNSTKLNKTDYVTAYSREFLYPQARNKGGDFTWYGDVSRLYSGSIEATTNGSYLDWADVYLTPGKYELVLTYITALNRGIKEIRFNNTVLLTLDSYTPTTIYANVNYTNFSINAPIKSNLTLRTVGKNPSSSAFYNDYTQISIHKVGEV